MLPTKLLKSVVMISIGWQSVNSAFAAEHQNARPDFETQVKPILALRCGSCHGPDLQESEIRFDTLSTDMVSNRAAAQTWHEARNAINAGEMPPEDEPQLTDTERSIVLQWISSSLQNAIEQQRSTQGRVVMRRLNNDEYQNTMFDLLGLEMDYTRDIPPDGMSPDGFRNNGQSLRLSAIQLESYLDAARRALDRVIVTGPPPKVFQHRFEKSNVGGWRGPTEQSNRLERAQKFLVKMVDDYPEEGDFRLRVQARSELRPDKGFPLMEVSLGYRPDTQVHFKVVGIREIMSEDSQQFEFRGRMENFPLPVRGQGKYPGLVVRVRNAYTDGSPVPNKLLKRKVDGKEVDKFDEEPHLPALVIDSVNFEGPVFSEWPPALHRQIMFTSETRGANEDQYITEVLRRFMSRAFRRPVSDSEVGDMVDFCQSLRSDFPLLEDAMRETLAMVLIQPDFLFLIEESSDEKGLISDVELASRLSYFLWSTMPDDRLLELAGHGLLHKPEILKLETERMLADARSDRFTSLFIEQWLRLKGVEYVSVDRSYYPNFDNAVKPAMLRESIELFAELLRNNESAISLLQSDFTMLNEPLARHYGVAGVYGQRFRPVELSDPRLRGGLLGHASVLLSNSTGQDSHPIRRAVWIRDRLLGDPPSPPPPNVPELDESNPDFAKLSVREQLQVHRQKDACASCHRSLDPWGIALENYDAVGHWRSAIRKKHGGKFETRPVNATDALPGGVRLDGAGGLRDHLLAQHKNQFARALVENLLTYALGRSLELIDQEEIGSITSRFAEDNYRLRSLVQLIVASESFRTK